MHATVEAERIEGVPRWPRDREIRKLVKRLNRRGLDSGGYQMRIAIKNAEAGRVYRVLTTHGMEPFLVVIDGLLKLGLEDQLRGTLATVDGFDAIFRPTRARQGDGFFVDLG